MNVHVVPRALLNDKDCLPSHDATNPFAMSIAPLDNSLSQPCHFPQEESRLASQRSLPRIRISISLNKSYGRNAPLRRPHLWASQAGCRELTPRTGDSSASTNSSASSLSSPTTLTSTGGRRRRRGLQGSAAAITAQELTGPPTT